MTTPEQMTPLKEARRDIVGGRQDSGSPGTLPAIPIVPGSGPKSSAGSGGIIMPTPLVSASLTSQLISIPPWYNKLEALRRDHGMTSCCFRCFDPSLPCRAFYYFLDYIQYSI